MNMWKIESNPIKQLIMSCAILIAGLVFILGMRGIDIHSSSNNMAAYLLGWLLLIIGIAGIITLNKQYITVDPVKKSIFIEDINLLNSKTMEILFDDIIDVRVTFFGKKSNYTVTYYVSLQLKSGKNYPLFFPAYYDGRWDVAVAESRCMKIKEFLNLSS